MQSLLFHSAFFNAPTYLTFALLLVLFAAAVYDVKTFTIPHVFTYLVIGLFAVLAFVSETNLSMLSWHLLSAVIAFVIGFVLFSLRLMGGGDVKIFTALALWVYPLGLLGLIISITTVGVVISLGVAGFKFVSSSAESTDETVVSGRLQTIRKIRIPYGPAIAIGTFFYLLFSNNLGF